MMKNGQGYFKNLALFTAQDFESMFDHEIFQIESVIFLWLFNFSSSHHITEKLDLIFYFLLRNASKKVVMVSTKSFFFFFFQNCKSS